MNDDPNDPKTIARKAAMFDQLAKIVWECIPKSECYSGPEPVKTAQSAAPAPICHHPDYAILEGNAFGKDRNVAVSVCSRCLMVLRINRPTP